MAGNASIIAKEGVDIAGRTGDGTSGIVDGSAEGAIGHEVCATFAELTIRLSVVSRNAGVTGIVGLVAGHALVDGCRASLAASTDKQVVGGALGADFEW